MKNIILPFVLVALFTSCSSLEQKYIKLDVGSSKSDVAKIMGPAPYRFTHENVEAWRYAVIGGFGYCDYREFYLFHDTLILKNEYNRASIAGCTVGLKSIDWETVLLAAEEYSKTHPFKENELPKTNIVEQLKELKKLKESGVITEAEFKKAKESVLNK